MKKFVLPLLVFALSGCFSPSQDQIDKAVQKEMLRRDEEKKHFFSMMDDYMKDRGFLAKAGARTVGSNEEIKRFNEVFDKKNLASSPSIGSKNAPITIVEFTDFACAPCRAAFPAIENLLNNDNYKKNIRVVYKFFLLQANISKFGAQAAMASYKLGRFRDMAALLFKTNSFDSTSIMSAASSLGMDQKTFADKMIDRDTLDRIEKDTEDASKISVKGVPKIFINGIAYEDPIEDEYLTKAIDDILSQVKIRK